MTKQKSKKDTQPVIEPEPPVEPKKVSKEKKVEKKSVESAKVSEPKKAKSKGEEKNNITEEVKNEVSDSTPKKTSETSTKKKAKISRPPTAYNIFMREKMSEISEGNQTDKLKTVAGLWKEISEEVKDEYNKRASEIKEQFMSSQENSNPTDSSKNQKKRLPNGYNIYLKEQMAIVEGENQKDKLVKIAAEWKSLGDNEKQKYKDQASQLKSEVEVSA